jgi:hypothetical protein
MAVANEDKEFVYAVRYPIAIHAYGYSPSNDVAHQ